MEKPLRDFWSKFRVFSLNKDGETLQISVNYKFISGLIIGAVLSAILW